MNAVCTGVQGIAPCFLCYDQNRAQHNDEISHWQESASFWWNGLALDQLEVPKPGGGIDSRHGSGAVIS